MCLQLIPATEFGRYCLQGWQGRESLHLTLTPEQFDALRMCEAWQSLTARPVSISSVASLASPTVSATSASIRVGFFATDAHQPGQRQSVERSRATDEACDDDEHVSHGCVLQ